ncbi:uncharacterized protein ARMOST_08180 [Armillaria ostoyae]|uniref:Uncharacterized protein n=1 Tax=Armillaria ostoyae TaxID=47428 RepID=A0A284R804_ARMOS|nr:uncharacterized protein ARMOST_08180 [Armillaria ostoyae]
MTIAVDVLRGAIPSIFPSDAEHRISTPDTSGTHKAKRSCQVPANLHSPFERTRKENVNIKGDEVQTRKIGEIS